MSFWILGKSDSCAIILILFISVVYSLLFNRIVILKGREPMFLQTYHHAGVVIFMWGITLTKNTATGGVVTCLNSFIHTLMYTYYVVAAFGISFPLKHYLTIAQMVQFVVGISIVMPTYWMEGCATTQQKLATAGIQIYAVVLIYLFYQFYQKSYTKKDGKKKVSDKKVE